MGKVAITCLGGLAAALWTENLWIGGAAYYGLLLLAMASTKGLSVRGSTRSAPDMETPAPCEAGA